MNGMNPNKNPAIIAIIPIPTTTCITKWIKDSGKKDKIDKVHIDYLVLSRYRSGFTSINFAF